MEIISRATDYVVASSIAADTTVAFLEPHVF